VDGFEFVLPTDLYPFVSVVISIIAVAHQGRSGFLTPTQLLPHLIQLDAGSHVWIICGRSVLGNSSSLYLDISKNGTYTGMMTS
jgi:hypothetical protein